MTEAARGRRKRGGVCRRPRVGRSAHSFSMRADPRARGVRQHPRPTALVGRQQPAASARRCGSRPPRCRRGPSSASRPRPAKMTRWTMTAVRTSWRRRSRGRTQRPQRLLRRRSRRCPHLQHGLAAARTRRRSAQLAAATWDAVVPGADCAYPPARTQLRACEIRPG